MKWSKKYKVFVKMGIFRYFSKSVKSSPNRDPISAKCIIFDFYQTLFLLGKWAWKMEKLQQNSSSRVDIWTFFKSPFFHNFVLSSLKSVLDTSNGLQKKHVLVPIFFQKVSSKSHENSKNYSKLKLGLFFPLTVPFSVRFQAKNGKFGKV